MTYTLAPRGTPGGPHIHPYTPRHQLPAVERLELDPIWAKLADQHRRRPNPATQHTINAINEWVTLTLRPHLDPTPVPAQLDELCSLADDHTHTR